MLSHTEASSTEEHPARRSTLLPCPGVPLPANFKTLPVLSRPEIASKIASGQLVVLHPPLVYQIPSSWLDRHPGGDLALLHYVGRDASNEIEAYHTGRTVKERMARWVVGRVELDDKEGWRDMVPPVQIGMWPIPAPTITVTAASPVETKAPPFPSANTPAATPRQLTTTLIDPPLGSSAPLTQSYQHHLRQSVRALHAHMHALDLFTPPDALSGYGHSLLLYSALLAVFIYLFLRATSLFDYIIAGVALGAFWHQITFVAHDAAHTGITGDWWTDRVIGIGIANFLGGLSIGWWADNHNVHHLVTNSPDHDPDIQHLPFFAISTRFFESLRSTYYDRIMVFDGFAKAVLPYQHNLYYIIMCFARFNLFANSYAFLYKSRPARGSPLAKLKDLELFGIAFFWLWFGALLRSIPTAGSRVAFTLVAFAVTSPLHVQIVLSHFSQPITVLDKATPAEELLESFAHRQLRTTMDIQCPPYLDFLHGGLHMQLSHHLMPRMPRFRFRAAQPIVKAWVAAEQRKVEEEGWQLKEGEGLEYKAMTFVEGNKDVLGVLREVATQARIMALVAEKVAKGELEAH